MQVDVWNRYRYICRTNMHMREILVVWELRC